MEKKIRIILDTNWYISATVNKASRRSLYNLIISNNLIIILSDEIIKEYKLVMQREKFSRLVNNKVINRFVSLVISRVEIIKIKSFIEGSRDKNDNFLLSLSLDGQADYLVTGDKDLLVLNESGNTKILTLSMFLEIISHRTQ